MPALLRLLAGKAILHLDERALHVTHVRVQSLDKASELPDIVALPGGHWKARSVLRFDSTQKVSKSILEHSNMFPGLVPEITRWLQHLEILQDSSPQRRRGERPLNASVKQERDGSREFTSLVHPAVQQRRHIWMITQKTRSACTPLRHIVGVT
jgi:hypothetical protein